MNEDLIAASNEKRTRGVKIDWPEYFSKEENIKNLFESIEFNDCKFISVKSTYTKDSNRYGVIVTTQNDDSGNSMNVVIDAISGEPTWNQLKDVTHNSGVNCENKIIIYDSSPGVGSPFDHDFDEYLSMGFAKVNNRYGVDTYIVKVITSDQKDSDTKDSDSLYMATFKYQVEEKPEPISNTNSMKLPSRDDFEKELFWIYYGDYGYNEFHMMHHPETWFDNRWGCIFHEIDFKFDWNQEAFYFQTIVDEKYGAKIIKWLFENNYREFHEIIRKYEINVSKLPEGDYKLIFILLNEPFSNFIDATTDKKIEYVEKLARMERELIGFYDEMTVNMGINSTGRENNSQ